jgi:hypothetical protein
MEMQVVQPVKEYEEAKEQKNPVHSRESSHDTSQVLSGEF